eukprot:scaffold7227_cov160-Amphora_coffeaeformis.AAC.12
MATKCSGNLRPPRHFTQSIKVAGEERPPMRNGCDLVHVAMLGQSAQNWTQEHERRHLGKHREKESKVFRARR